MGILRPGSYPGKLVPLPEAHREPVDALRKALQDEDVLLIQIATRGTGLETQAFRYVASFFDPKATKILVRYFAPLTEPHPVYAGVEIYFVLPSRGRKVEAVLVRGLPHE